MIFDEFRNGLRILASIDHHELPEMGEAEYNEFRNDPFRYFIKTDDDMATRIWSVVTKRQGDL